MTQPLVPSHIDLRDFAFLPLDAVRLRDSSLALKASDAEFRAAVLLWCVAWHQVPAASLPDDDADLAAFVGFGRDVRKWKRLREGALRGFRLCDDGRLYHQVLAEKALEAWEGRLRLRHRKECERIKKAAQRGKTDAHYPSFDEWKDNLTATGSDRWVFVPEASQGTSDMCPVTVPRESLSLKGQGEGQGQGEGYLSSSLTTEANTHVATDAESAARACVLMSEAGCKSVSVSRPELLAAIGEGVTPEQLADTAIEAIGAGKTNPFAWAIATARKRKAGTPKAVNGAHRHSGVVATPSATTVKRKPPNPQVVGEFMGKIAEQLKLA